MPVMQAPVQSLTQPPLSQDEVLQRVWELKQLHQRALPERERIRAIMNGGPDGLAAMLGENMKKLDHRVPAANMVLSGMTRLGQKLGRMPTLKKEVPPSTGSGKTSRRARRRGEKLLRIVESYDEMDRLEMQLPQVGRWLPGYGFVVWTFRTRWVDGFPYPEAELRDPYDCYPGYWGPSQQPDDLAVIRRIPRETLARQFPQFRAKIFERENRPRAGKGVLLREIVGGGTWENLLTDGVELAEYRHVTGTYVVAPELKLTLSFVPNMLGEPDYVVAKRFAFDRLIGQYDQAIGLASAFTKANIMTMLAMEDAVFTETNVYGEKPFGGIYRKGRDEVNYFPSGTRVEKPVANMPYQIFQEIDRMERQFRQQVGYSVQDDAQSPLSFATGRGLDELQGAVDIEIGEYQKVLRWALKDRDRKMLKYDELLWGGERKPMTGEREGVPFQETYDPATDVAGDYRVARKYGVMANWDEPSKIITGLQMLDAQILDVETIQENLDGVDNISLIRERIRRDNAERALMGMLTQAAANPGDPRGPLAQMALSMIFENPRKFDEAIKQFFTPEEPEMEDPQSEFAGQAGPPQGVGGIGDVLAQLGGDSTTTTLGRITGTGVEAGVQRVGTL